MKLSGVARYDINAMYGSSAFFKRFSQSEPFSRPDRYCVRIRDYTCYMIEVVSRILRTIVTPNDFRNTVS